MEVRNRGKGDNLAIEVENRRENSWKNTLWPCRIKEGCNGISENVRNTTKE